MADKVQKIISPEGIKNARNELAHLFRTIAWETGVRGPEWEYKLRKYLEQLGPQLKTAKDRSYARGNLNAQLMDRKMTWRTFIEAMNFLGALRMRLKVELDWPNNQSSTHTMQVRLRQSHRERSVAENVAEILHSSHDIEMDVEEAVEALEKMDEAFLGQDGDKEKTIQVDVEWPRDVTVHRARNRKPSKDESPKKNYRQTVEPVDIDDDDDSPPFDGGVPIDGYNEDEEE
jgi:hypothetical protein